MTGVELSQSEFHGFPLPGDGESEVCHVDHAGDSLHAPPTQQEWHILLLENLNGIDQLSDLPVRVHHVNRELNLAEAGSGFSSSKLELLG